MVTNDSDIDMDLLSSIFKIVLIDLVLSGDNAVVIGMAAHRLPPRQRKFAILFGGGAAIVLRIALTMIAARQHARGDLHHPYRRLHHEH